MVRHSALKECDQGRGLSTARPRRSARMKQKKRRSRMAAARKAKPTAKIHIRKTQDQEWRECQIRTSIYSPHALFVRFSRTHLSNRLFSRFLRNLPKQTK